MTGTLSPASPDPATYAFLDDHLDKIAEIADLLRRLEPTGQPLRELVVQLELHAVGAQDELVKLKNSGGQRSPSPPSDHVGGHP
jgi:hypothetical protein